MVDRNRDRDNKLRTGRRDREREEREGTDREEIEERAESGERERKREGVREREEGGREKGMLGQGLKSSGMGWKPTVLSYRDHNLYPKVSP